MFLKPPGKPTRFKKIVYLSATTFLGVMLAFLVHAFVEMAYLSYARVRGEAVVFYGGCALPPALQAGFWILGVVGGFLLGFRWWQIIYIERRYWK